MSFTSMTNPVTGTPVSTSGFGDVAVANIDYLAGTDRWKLTTVDATTNDFASSGTAQVIAWELETYDPMSLHGTGSLDKQILIAEPGLYVVAPLLTYATNSTGTRDVWVSKGPTGTTPSNSTSYIVAAGRESAWASLPTPVQVYTEVQCAAGDVLWVVGSQTSGGALAIAASSWMNSFIGRWVASS